MNIPTSSLIYRSFDLQRDLAALVSLLQIMTEGDHGGSILHLHRENHLRSQFSGDFLVLSIAIKLYLISG